MKRTILATVLVLAGTLGAQADVDVWLAMPKHDDLQASSDACDQ